MSGKRNTETDGRNPLLWNLSEIGVKLNKTDKKIAELWFLCCEDMAIPEGGCEKCEFLDDCEEARIKIFGSKDRDKFQFG